MNQRKLLKELDLNQGLKIRDFIGFNLSSDMLGCKSALHDWIEAEFGDHIVILSFKWKDEKTRLKSLKRLISKMKKWKQIPRKKN